MKFLVALILLFSFSAFADYKSEYDDIGKFWVEEYANQKNYHPLKPGAVPIPYKEFVSRLKKNPKMLRYFFVCAVNSRIRRSYQDDKAFALYLESKFKGKKLRKEDIDKVANFTGDFILKDKNILHIEAIKNVSNADAYYRRVLAELDKAKF